MDKKKSTTLWRKNTLCIAVCAAIGQNVSAEEAADTVYEEILVTGQKIERSLQDTPTSIAVFDSATLEEQELGSLDETLLEAANVHSISGGFNIRGIDGFNVSGAGNSALASIYIDNSAMPRRAIANGFSTWDIDQVEVLRGPQSTLQGRNSLAGAIIMTSAKPTHEWEGKYRLEVGQHGQREAAIAFGGSVIEDELAFRFSAENQNFDGFNENITRREDADYRDDELYRLKFLYTPSGMPELSAQLSLTHSLTERGPSAVNVPTDGSDPHNNRVISNNDPQVLHYQTDIAALDLSYEINDQWSFDSITTYSKNKSYWENYDDDNGPVAGGTRYNNEESKTISQEFRVTFEYEKLSGLFGAYYFNQKIPATFGGITRLSLASVGLSAPVLQATFGLDPATAAFVIAQYAPIDPAILEQTSSLREEISSVALFTDVTYKINEKWDVFAGVRWDKEENENQDSANFIIANADLMPNPVNYPAPLNQLIAGINAQLNANAAAASSDRPLVDASFNEIIPKLGVSYHWNDDVSTSFTVQRGYRSGGVGINSARGAVYQYDPEFTDNYEFSLRSLWLDGDLVLNANVFLIEWDDQQVNVQLSGNTFDSEVRNAGRSEVRGFEIESRYQFNEAWEFNASVGRASTEFKEFDVVIPTGGQDIVRDLSGRSFADAPEWTANAGVSYRGDNGVFANFNMNYADSSPADVDPYIRGLSEGDPNFDLQNEGRTLANLRFGYEWDQFAIYLLGKNLFDKEYIERAAFGTGRRIVRHDLGEPRQVSLVLRGSF